MIDTHCHLVFPDFAGRIDQVMADARTAGVTGAITISTSSHDAEASMRVADEHDHVWFSVGVHPLYADKVPHDWRLLKQLAKHDKCVAWGELGLDNHHARPPRAVQDQVLAEELAFIESCVDEGIDHPIVIHCRDAFDDLIPILRSTRIDGSRFVFHCFTAGPDEARKVLDLGAMISFTGVVTYRNAKPTADAAKLAPPDRILCETDAPFLSPEPKRGERPCVPAFSRITADFIADLRGTPNDQFLRQINQNTENFFGIPAVELGEGA